MPKQTINERQHAILAELSSRNWVDQRTLHARTKELLTPGKRIAWQRKGAGRQIGEVTCVMGKPGKTRIQVHNLVTDAVYMITIADYLAAEQTGLEDS